jgi:hypothetical protein
MRVNIYLSGRAIASLFLWERHWRCAAAAIENPRVPGNHASRSVWSARYARALFWIRKEARIGTDGYEFDQKGTNSTRREIRKDFSAAGKFIRERGDIAHSCA